MGPPRTYTIARAREDVTLGADPSIPLVLLNTYFVPGAVLHRTVGKSTSGPRGVELKLVLPVNFCTTLVTRNRKGLELQGSQIYALGLY